MFAARRCSVGQTLSRHFSDAGREADTAVPAVLSQAVLGFCASLVCDDIELRTLLQSNCEMQTSPLVIDQLVLKV
jgi:hypothetical protein